jgi:hypothetical protein
MNNWVGTFGGNPIKPQYPQYEEIALSANIELVWPIETMETAPYVAAWVNVSPSIGSLSITMPPATEGSTGIASLVTNAGANDFTLRDNDGGAIAVIATGEAWVVGLTDNSTNAGTWLVLQLGALTSQAQASALAGNGLQAFGALLQTTIWPRVVSAGGTILASDRARGIVWTGVIGTMQLDARATLTEKWWCLVTNNGSGVLTLSTTGGDTINGVASITLPVSGLPVGYSVLIAAGATEFKTFLGIPTPTPISAGGTGANNAGSALTNLGGTGIGISIFTAPNAAAVLALLGITPNLLTEKTIGASQGVSAGDTGTVFVATTALQLSLPQTTTVTKSFIFCGYAQGGAITLHPDPADSVNGGVAGANLVVAQGSSFLLVNDHGGNWWPLFLSVPPSGVWAVSGGTVNAITATFAPANTTLTDGLILAFRATGANTSTTPTFAPDGLTAHTITRMGGQALLAGDIPGNLAECLVRYNLANTRWELLNPASRQVPWVAAGGTADVITATYSPANTMLYDGLLLSFRATAPNATNTPTFAPDGLTARNITKKGGQVLTPGDIPANNAECLVRYNLAQTRWELLNTGSSAAGSAGGTSGLKVTNNGGTPNTKIDVTAGSLAVSDGTSTVNLSNVSVTIDGTVIGANGIDAGALAATTWYYVFVIYNSSSLTTAGLISLSATVPTLPAGYTFMSRVGAMRTDGAAHFLRTLQYGRTARYTSPPLPQMSTGAAGDVTIPTWVAVSVASYVPPTATMIALFATIQGTNSVIIAAPNPNYGNDVSTANPAPYVTFANTNTRPGYLVEFLLESGNVYWANSGTTPILICAGWEDAN